MGVRMRLCVHPVYLRSCGCAGDMHVGVGARRAHLHVCTRAHVCMHACDGLYLREGLSREHSVA